MKKLFVSALIILSAALILFNIPTAQSLNTLIEAVPIEELDTLSVERTYSFEETMTYMKESGYEEKDIQQFKKNHEENLKLKSAESAIIRYSLFTMDGIRFSSGLWACRLQPQILAGLQYSISPTPDKIISLENHHVYAARDDKCSFAGRMGYKLISGKEFYIFMQGTAYKDGQVKISLDGENATMIVSNSKKFLKDIPYQESYYSSDLME